MVLSLSSRRLSGPGRSGADAAAAASRLLQSLGALLAVVQEQQSRLLLVGSPPQITCPIGQGVSMLYGRGGASAVANACSPSHVAAQRLDQPLDQLYRGLTDRYPSTVQRLSILPLFCGVERCQLQNQQRQLLIWDDLAHLTPTGLERLRQPLLNQVEGMLAKGANARQ